MSAALAPPTTLVGLQHIGGAAVVGNVAADSSQGRDILRKEVWWPSPNAIPSSASMSELQDDQRDSFAGKCFCETQLCVSACALCVHP